MAERDYGASAPANSAAVTMYESSPSPVTSRQQHEAELRRMSLARASAFNLVGPHAFDAQTKGTFAEQKA